MLDIASAHSQTLSIVHFHLCCNTQVLYGFNNLMAWWTEDFDTPTSWDNLHKDFRGLHFNRKLISSNNSSVKTLLFTQRFLFWTELVSLNFFSLYIVFLFGTGSLGKQCLNLWQTSSIIFNENLAYKNALFFTIHHYTTTHQVDALNTELRVWELPY